MPRHMSARASRQILRPRKRAFRPPDGKQKMEPARRVSKETRPKAQQAQQQGEQKKVNRTRHTRTACCYCCCSPSSTPHHQPPEMIQSTVFHRFSLVGYRLRSRVERSLIEPLGHRIICSTKSSREFGARSLSVRGMVTSASGTKRYRRSLLNKTAFQPPQYTTHNTHIPRHTSNERIKLLKTR